MSLNFRIIRFRKGFVFDRSRITIDDDVPLDAVRDACLLELLRGATEADVGVFVGLPHDQRRGGGRAPRHGHRHLGVQLGQIQVHLAE